MNSIGNRQSTIGNPIDWGRFAQCIHGHQRFVLTSHIRPDCDALGSELGMAGILESLGKQALIANAHPVPANLRFIDPQQRIRALGVDVQAADLEGYDALMILDTSAWGQLGEMADVIKASAADKFVLDHHLSQDDLGAEVFKDVTAEATGRLVLEAAEHLGVTLTADMATPLFAALATDTGWFRFPSTTSDTYRAAARLIDAGARPQEIYNALYEQHSLARLRLVGSILSRAETELQGRLIYSAVLHEDFDATGALPSDTEDVINMMLSVQGAEVAVLFVEQPHGRFKASFRSRSQVDCSRLAEVFGGGGHKAAAGATVAGSWSAVRDRVLDAVRQAMQ